jgi:hypothetical protein
MPHQIDRVKTADENLIDLINTASTYTFEGTEFTHGNPTEYVPESPDTSNTQILLTSVPGSGITGTKTVRYRRLEMGETKTGASTTFTVEDGDDRTSLEQKIAVEHNLVIGEFALVGDIPEYGDPDSNCTIEAVSNSVLYFGTAPVVLSEALSEPVPAGYFVRMNTQLVNMVHASSYIAAVGDVIGRSGTIDPASVGPGITLSELDLAAESSGAAASCTGTVNDLVPNGVVCEWEIIGAGSARMSVGFLSGSGSYDNSAFRAGDDNFPGPFGTWYDSDGQVVAAGQSSLVAPTYTVGDVIGIINRSGVGTLFFKNGTQVLSPSGTLNFPRAVISFEAV